MAAPAQPRRLYAFGPFRLDPASHVLMRDRQILPLSPKIVETLLVLVENHGNLVSKDDLLKSVWPDTIVEESNLTHNVSVLRKTLGAGGYIETVPKRGYRFARQVSVRWEEAFDEPAAPVLLRLRAKAAQILLAGAIFAAALYLMWRLS